MSSFVICNLAVIIEADEVSLLSEVMCSSFPACWQLYDHVAVVHMSDGHDGLILLGSPK